MSTPFRPLPTLFLLALLATVQPARAAIYTVGSPVGPGQCSHGSLQAAVNAAEGNPGTDTIRVTRSIAHVAQAVQVTTSQELEITGGFATCTQAIADTALTTLDGSGGATEPVLRVTLGFNGVLRLRQLRITGGDEDGGGHGGGVYFRGAQSRLEIHDSELVDNIAGYGGGLYAEGTGLQTRLVIGANVLVAGNRARYSGGGIYADVVEMTMTEPGSMLFNNEAQGIDGGGFGGGLVVLARDAPAIARIGSGGRGNLGAVSWNRARHGGGVAVGGHADDFGARQVATLEVFTTDPQRPAKIAGNFASQSGGALHLRGYAGNLDGWVDAHAYLWNAELSDNSAPQGAAVQLAASPDPVLSYRAESMLHINATDGRPAGAAPCPIGQPCGRIVGNVALDAGGNPTQGALIRAESNTIVLIGDHPFGVTPRGGLLIQDNRGGRLVDSDGSGGDQTVMLRNALVAGNEFGLGVVRAQGNGRLRVRDVTVAGNAIAAGPLIAATGRSVVLGRSILWQPGRATLARSGGTLSIETLIASELASLGAAVDAFDLPPRFIDPERDDYRLRAASPAVDIAAPVDGDDRDVHGLQRDLDLPAVANGVGMRDIGAFERQGLAPLLLAGTFDDPDLRHWTHFAGAWDGSENPAGPAGSGAWRFGASGLTEPRVALGLQCIHLPGPGLYRLTGHGRAGGNTIATRDHAVLRWELRRDGHEACTAGPPDASGHLVVGSGANWSYPAQPAIIAVQPDDWTRNASITVVLSAEDGGISSPRTISAWFDGISLAFLGADRVFANGFDP